MWIVRLALRRTYTFVVAALLTGFNAGDTVVIHPGDGIPEGTVVEPVPLPK